MHTVDMYVVSWQELYNWGSSLIDESNKELKDRR